MLGWKPSPDTKAVGYALYTGLASGTYTVRTDVGATNTCTASNLTAGVTYYFMVTAFDLQGLESVPSNEVSYTVPTNARPVLTISATNLTKVYGAPIGIFTPVYTGFVDGDTPANLASLPVLTTTASNSSPVGSYSIHPSGASSTKYALQYIDGTLTITPAATAGTLTSSANPSLPGEAVSFALALDVVPPGQGLPTGTVQFRIDGARVGPPAAMDKGTAVLRLSNLTHGNHTVLAEYPGDGNFTGTTNQLGSYQLVNTPPLAPSRSVEREGTNEVKLSISSIMANVSDADGDVVTFLGPSEASTQDGSISSSGGWLFYSPVSGSTNADSFTYTIGDGYGAPATGTVYLTPRVDTGSSPDLTVSALPDGSILIEGDGIPGRTYRLESSASANAEGQPAWQPLGAASADDSGLFYSVDARGSLQNLYRALYP